MRTIAFGLSFALLLAGTLLAGPALAQEEVGEHAAGSGWEFGGEVALLSDYVWRGVSQTRGKPALQLDLNLTHDSGVYAGVWASNVDFTASDDEDDGVRHELDPYIGWSGDIGGGMALDMTLTRVSYPGHKPDFNYAYTELEARLDFRAPVYVGMAWSPDIFALGGRGLYYNVGTELELGDSGLRLDAQIGHYDLRKAAGDSYNDFVIGLARDFGPLTARLSWTGVNSYGEALSEALDDASQASSRVALGLHWQF